MSLKDKIREYIFPGAVAAIVGSLGALGWYASTLPLKQPNKAAYQARDMVQTPSESYLIDLNGDRIVDLESRPKTVIDVQWVAEDMVEAAQKKGFRVDEYGFPTLRMSPEMRDAASRMFNASNDYDFATAQKRFQDYQVSLKKH